MYIFLKWPEITSCFFKVDRNYFKLGPKLPQKWSEVTWTDITGIQGGHGYSKTSYQGHFQGHVIAPITSVIGCLGYRHRFRVPGMVL